MAERLFKFLGRGRIGRFSDAAWPAPGEWLSATGPLEPCVSGIHVCRPGDLPYWLDDRLWEVEVGGERIEHLEKLVVERARLTSKVAAWPDPLATQLAEDCLSELRRLAQRELDRSDDPDGSELAEAADDVEAAHAARTLSRRDRPARTAAAGGLVAFFADAGEMVADRHALGSATVGRYVAYIAAHAADRATPEEGTRLPPGMTPFAVERQRQAELLSQKLAL